MRARAYMLMLGALTSFADFVKSAQYDDVTAEQQVALHEFLIALARARDVARAVVLAFNDERML